MEFCGCLKAAMHLIQIWNLSLLTCMLKCILDIVGLHKRWYFTPKLTYYYPYLFFRGLLVTVKNQVYNRLWCFPQFFFSPHHLQVKYLVLDKSIAVSLGQIPFFGRSSSDFPLTFHWRSRFSFRGLNQSITIILIACNTKFFGCEDPNLFQDFLGQFRIFVYAIPNENSEFYLFCYDPHRIRELPATTWFLLESNSRFWFEKLPKLLVSSPTNPRCPSRKWWKNVIFPSSAALMTQEGLRRVFF